MSRAQENRPGVEIPSFRLIGPALGQVRDLICQSLAAPDAQQELASFVGRLRAGSARMLRPGLVLLAGRCCGTLSEQHLRVAAMLEMIYHATLLHDRVLDEDCPAGGLPAAECRWGNETAVLLGDFVLSHVFRMAADLESGAAQILARIAVQVCEGELRQTLQKHNWQLSEAESLDIVGEKSASFFGGGYRLGALLAGADADRVEALARFGFLAGLASRIMDELGGAAGTGDRPGLAAVHLLRTVDPADRARVRAMLEAPRTAKRELREMLERHGSLEYARARAADYAAQAAQAVAEVPPGPAKGALLETARFLVDPVP